MKRQGRAYLGVRCLHGVEEVLSERLLNIAASGAVSWPGVGHRVCSRKITSTFERSTISLEVRFVLCILLEICPMSGIKFLSVASLESRRSRMLEVSLFGLQVFVGRPRGV